MLLRLCDALINHHVANASESSSTLITHTDLIDTIHDFLHQLDAEELMSQPVPEQKRTDASSALPPQAVSIWTMQDMCG